MSGKRPRCRQYSFKLNATDHVGIAAISIVILQLGHVLLKSRNNYDGANVYFFESILLLMANGFCFANRYTLQALGTSATVQTAFCFLKGLFLGVTEFNFIEAFNPLVYRQCGHMYSGGSAVCTFGYGS